MKRLLMTIAIACSLGLVASVALAAVSTQNGTSPSQLTGTSESKVPQAQIDRVQKREEMDKRRAELLKMRQQLIENNNPGNVDGQQKKQ